MEKDEYYMNLALKQARLGEKRDEVPVGAVIVDSSGDIIGCGYNRPISSCDPSAHAEMIALRMAGEKKGNYRLTGAVIYATIEPCIMCMGAIIHARLSKVVYGAPDLKWGACGSLYDFATDQRLNHNLEVVPGVCVNETRNVIQSFFRNKRSRKCQTQLLSVPSGEMREKEK